MTATPAPEDEGRNDHNRAGGSLPTVTRDDVPRAGNMVRATLSRSVHGVCLGCTAEFDNTGAGASHARARRHAVHVDYATRFTFVPAERLMQAVAEPAGHEAQEVAS